MRISGFSFGKNVTKLYYPVKEAVMSILPIVDEFVFALGAGDEDDDTRELLESINSPKLKIVDTVWDIETYPRGMENAHQTDIAKSHCTGDWLFYVQADEVVHEKYLPVIQARCEELLPREEVEGLLFNYKHFWGDYDHYQLAHGWYKKEIRIVRNRSDIHSWESAQSFRRIPEFDGLNYRQQQGTHKLKVAPVDAEIFHYGWVRPPQMMRKKTRSLDTIHKGAQKVGEMYQHLPPAFDYGNLSKLARFTDTHPAVMEDFIARFDWQDQLQYSGPTQPGRALHKHETLKNRVVTFLEQHVFGGKELFPFKNYELIQP
ncbi:MAG: hypothetical protein AAGI38_13435 [Bacteroidota bacterium]